MVIHASIGNAVMIEVYTIGHSNASFDKIAQLLRKYGIEVLVDVRSSRSRWAPQFNQRNLEATIPKLGIEYQYLGKHLGGLPDDPAFYKPNSTRKRKSDPLTVVDYNKLAQQDWFQGAIDKLIEVATKHRTVIMCSEEDPRTCHRSQLVGETLTKRGIKVLHIRGNGELEEQQSQAIQGSSNLVASRKRST